MQNKQSHGYGREKGLFGVSINDDSQNDRNVHHCFYMGSQPLIFTRAQAQSYERNGLLGVSRKYISQDDHNVHHCFYMASQPLREHRLKAMRGGGGGGGGGLPHGQVARTQAQSYE